MTQRSKNVRVPFEIPTAEIFTASIYPQNPYTRTYQNRIGDTWTVTAPRTPLAFDMISFLGALWFSQRSGSPCVPSGPYRHMVEIRATEYLDLLHLSRFRLQDTLWPSVKFLGKIDLNVQFAEPQNHVSATGEAMPEACFQGLFGDTILDRARGRKGNTIRIFPLNWFVKRARRLTINLDDMIEMKSPTARCIAFFLTGRSSGSGWLSAGDWMRVVGCDYKRIGDFRRHSLVPALRELKKRGYVVKEENGLFQVRPKRQTSVRKDSGSLSNVR